MRRIQNAIAQHGHRETRFIRIQRDKRCARFQADSDGQAVVMEINARAWKLTRKRRSLQTRETGYIFRPQSILPFIWLFDARLEDVRERFTVFLLHPDTRERILR